MFDEDEVRNSIKKKRREIKRRKGCNNLGKAKVNELKRMLFKDRRDESKKQRS